MNKQLDDVELDRLLARHAVLRDDGFLDTMTERLLQEKPLSDISRQPRLFGLLGGVWLLLAMLTGVPGQILQWINAYRAWFTEFAQTQAVSGVELTVTTLQSLPLLLIVIAVSFSLLLFSALRD